MTTLTADIIHDLNSLATPLISDVMARMVGIKGLQAYHKPAKLIGTALTVKTRPGDNLYLYKALAQVRPGEVIVIDGGGDDNNALLGEIIKHYAQSKGCSGFIVDGAIRDIGAFGNDTFPCYARSHIHRGPYKTGPGQLRTAVSIGGQVVNNGDIIVGDEDGIVVIPPEQLREVITAAQAKDKVEQEMMAEIASGREQQNWLDSILIAGGIK